MNIDICVCTYRRAHVAETLRSLARLDRKPDWTLRAIVIDNDDTPSAFELTEATAREMALTLTYVHAPARNISVARNAGLDAAKAPLLAFIDDDEIAENDWLTALVTTMEQSKADVVLGLVRAIYPPNSPTWMIEGDFHSTQPVWVKDEIVTGYTCNVLLRREAPALRGLRFRNELGRTGGEDTVFFAALHQAGGTIAYAPDAVVTEAVTGDRTKFSWLVKRVFRTGQTHGSLLLERDGHEPKALAKNIALASVKAAFCFMMILPTLLRPARWRFWLLRGVLHVGVVARLLGKSELKQYG